MEGKVKNIFTQTLKMLSKREVEKKEMNQKYENMCNYASLSRFLSSVRYELSLNYMDINGEITATWCFIYDCSYIVVGQTSNCSLYVFSFLFSILFFLFILIFLPYSSFYSTVLPSTPIYTYLQTSDYSILDCIHFLFYFLFFPIQMSFPSTFLFLLDGSAISSHLQIFANTWLFIVRIFISVFHFYPYLDEFSFHIPLPTTISSHLHVSCLIYRAISLQSAASASVYFPLTSPPLGTWSKINLCPV